MTLALKVRIQLAIFCVVLCVRHGRKYAEKGFKLAFVLLIRTKSFGAGKIEGCSAFAEQTVHILAKNEIPIHSKKDINIGCS